MGWEFIHSLRNHSVDGIRWGMTTETNEPARKPLEEVDENTFLWDLVRG